MSYFQKFPQTRLRRQRRKEFIRRLCRDTQLSTDDLIYPVFICSGQTQIQKIDSMPNVYRYSLDELMKVAEQCVALKIPAIALFPAIDGKLKSLDAKEAMNSKGLVPEAIRQIKSRFPDLGVIADVALDPYTTHGQDGVIDDHGYVLNDETNIILQQQAICLADAGADIVAPSDMMDGRIGVIRNALDENHFKNVAILSYAAKYASGFYGPFRDAVQSKQNLATGDKKSYQLDPRHRHDAFSEVAMDISEGADFVMVKPGLPYLDVIARLRDHFHMPIWAYQVSGEYAMLAAAAQNGWVDLESCAMESLYSFKRAGVGAIITYFALDAARWLEG